MVINWVASWIEAVSSKKLSWKYSPLYLMFIWWGAIFITNMVLAIILWENLVLPEFNLAWGYLFWYAIAWLIGYWTIIEWLKYVEANLWGLIWLLEIIFAIIYGILFFNEVLTLNIIIWWILILIAAWLSDIIEYFRKKKKDKNIIN
jgi:drug/metabolite transporter (DMT)-like permease